MNAASQQQGIPATVLIEKMIEEQFALAPPKALVMDAENAAVVALMDEWLAAMPTDPEQIRQDDAEREEFLQHLNRNRIEARESPLFPRVCTSCSTHIHLAHMPSRNPMLISYNGHGIVNLPETGSMFRKWLPMNFAGTAQGSQNQ